MNRFERWRAALEPKHAAMVALGYRSEDLLALVCGDEEPKLVPRAGALAEMRRTLGNIATRIEAAGEPGALLVVATVDGETMLFKIRGAH